MNSTIATTHAETRDLRALYNRAADAMSGMIGHGFLALANRISIGAIFFLSGRTKVDGLLTVNASAVTLFREEYKLPVVPLPAQSLLDATPVVTRPRDGLTQAANNAAQMATPAGPTVPAGKDGGYQLQVSSFRTQNEAQHFADQLRARGHRAYVIEAHVPGRGTWFRVRIGPFPSQANR